jgi:hypothetical protein
VSWEAAQGGADNTGPRAYQTGRVSSVSGYAAPITESSPRGSATIQLTAGTSGVVFDTLSWERGTDGQSRQGHSVARLSVREVVRSRGLLGEALAVAELAAIDQPSLPYLQRAA